MAIRILCVVYAALAILVMDPLAWVERPFFGLFATAHTLLALILAFRPSRGAAAQWLGLALVLVAFSVWLGFMAGDGWLFGPYGLPEHLDLPHMAVGGGAFLQFARAFGNSTSPKRGPANIFAGWPLAAGIGVGAAYWLGTTTRMLNITQRELLVFGWMAAAFFVGGLVLYRTYRRGNEGERLRIKWVVLAGLIWLIPFAAWVSLQGMWSLGLRYAWMIDGLRVQSVLMIIATLGSSILVYGMLTHGSIDPSFAIRKTTVFTTLGVVFIFLLAGLGNLVESWVESALGLPGAVGTVAVGGSIAVALIPLKRRLDGWTERILPGAEAESESPAADLDG